MDTQFLAYIIRRITFVIVQGNLRVWELPREVVEFANWIFAHPEVRLNPQEYINYWSGAFLQRLHDWVTSELGFTPRSVDNIPLADRLPNLDRVRRRLDPGAGPSSAPQGPPATPTVSGMNTRNVFRDGAGAPAIGANIQRIENDPDGHDPDVLDEIDQDNFNANQQAQDANVDAVAADDPDLDPMRAPNGPGRNCCGGSHINFFALLNICRASDFPSRYSDSTPRMIAFFSGSYLLLDNTFIHMFLNSSSSLKYL